MVPRSASIAAGVAEGIRRRRSADNSRLCCSRPPSSAHSAARIFCSKGLDSRFKRFDALAFIDDRVSRLVGDVGNFVSLPIG